MNSTIELVKKAYSKTTTTTTTTIIIIVKLILLKLDHRIKEGS